MPSALVTGAGRGIGEAVARRLHEAGYRVGAFDLEPCAWAEGLEGVTTGALDVTDPDAWARALAGFCGEGGSLDLLVNNAGVLYGSRFEDASFEQDSTLVDVNVKGVLYGCRAAYGYLRRAGDPCVVNLCSASAIYGQPEMVAYSASKFAVRGITEGLDLEWAPQGIRVRSVWPLFVHTHLLDDSDTAGMRSLGTHLVPEDVADDVLRVAGIPVSGGRPGLLDRAASAVAAIGGPAHRPVGRQAALMYTASQLVPAALTRLVNKRITR